MVHNRLPSKSLPTSSALSIIYIPTPIKPTPHIPQPPSLEPHLFLIHLCKEFNMVILEEHLGLAQRPTVHLETQQQESTVVPGGCHSLIKVKGQETVPGGRGEEENIL